MGYYQKRENRKAKLLKNQNLMGTRAKVIDTMYKFKEYQN